MKYQFVACDVDGTLTDDNRTISADNVEALKRMKREGINVFLVSGRQRIVLQDVVDLLHVDGIPDYYATINGGEIYCNGNLLYRSLFPKDDYVQLTEFGVKRNVCVKLTLDDGDILINASENDVQRFKRMLKKVGTYCMDEVADSHFSVSKVMYILNGAEFPLNEEEKRFLSRYDIYYKKGEFMEVNFDCNKGKAVKFLRDYLNVGKESVIAFGDDDNDAPMFQEAGCSVCGKNGSEFAKRSATKVSDFDNNHSFVAKELNGIQ